MVALGRVVVDHVEDDLDARGVEGLDHPLELLHLLAALARRGVAVVRRQEADRVVAPVVAQAALDEVRVLDELVHGQELDGGDAEREQVLDGGRMGEAGVRAPHVLRDVRVRLGEALDVDLVDDAVVERRPRRTVVRPVEVGADHDRPGHVRRAVRVVEGALRVREAVVEQRLVPAHVAVDRDRVRVEQELGRVAAQASGGVVGPVDAVAVALPRAHVRRVAVPDPRGHLGQRLAGLGAVLVEQAQLDELGRLGEDREVRADAVVGRAEREWGSWPEHSSGPVCKPASPAARWAGPARRPAVPQNGCPPTSASPCATSHCSASYSASSAL